MPASPSKKPRTDITRVPRRPRATDSPKRTAATKAAAEARRIGRKVGEATRTRAVSAGKSLRAGAKQAEAVARRAATRPEKTIPRVGEGRPARPAKKSR